MDWDACFNMCSAANAIMPCVQNLDQQNYLVANRAGNSFWVGIYKTPGTNDWNWPTGCTSSFLYLNQGEGFIQSEPVALSFIGTPEGYWADCPKSWTALCFCQTNALSEPTSQPSRQPTSQPSRQPTSQPSQPTSHPPRADRGRNRRGAYIWIPSPWRRHCRRRALPRVRRRAGL